MWRQKAPGQGETVRRRSQEHSKNEPHEIELKQLTKQTNPQQKCNESNENHHEYSANSPRSSVRSLTAHRIDGQAARRMIEAIRTTEARLTELKKECRAHCTCKVCVQSNFTRKVCIDNMNEIVWSGPLLINPNTDKYRMVRGTLTFLQFCGIGIKEVVKVKYLIDKDLYVPIIKITHAKGVEQSETRFLPNLKEGIDLMLHFVFVILSVTQRYWTKFTTNHQVEGFIYRKYAINAAWEKIHVRGEKGTLWEEGQQGKQVEMPLKSGCLWTNFMMIDWQMPHLIVKVWSGIWKVEYGLPINQLSQWLSVFLSCVRLD